MKKNVGLTDMVVRIVLGTVFIAIYSLAKPTGILGTATWLSGVLLLCTGLANRCLLYLPFKFSTYHKK